MLQNPSYNKNPRISLKEKCISYYKFGMKVIIPFENDIDLENVRLHKWEQVFRDC